MYPGVGTFVLIRPAQTFYERINLGEEAFRRGFTNLNLRMWGFVHSEGCIGIDEGVCHLKAAFVDSAAPEDAAVAEEIINRRYYGTSASAPQ